MKNFYSKRFNGESLVGSEGDRGQATLLIRKPTSVNVSQLSVPPLTSCIFCCLLRSSVSRSEGLRWAISSSLCSSSLRCSNTRVSSGFSSSTRPLHGRSESDSHKHSARLCLKCAPHWGQRGGGDFAVGFVPLPFVAEQQLPLQVLVARRLHRGAVQFAGRDALVAVAVRRGLTGNPVAANRGLWGTQTLSFYPTNVYFW